MIDQGVIESMVAAAAVSHTDTILEIGPGFGTLTVALAERSRSVVAVELDKRFAPALDKLATVYPALQCVYGDIFREWATVAPQLNDQKYKLVSNLPYNITSLVLRRFLENALRPSSATLLIQREVAERVVAAPGAMSILSVAVQFYSSPKIIRVVDPSSFWPAPTVHSAIIHLRGIGTDPHGHAQKLGEITTKQFFRVVRVGFAARRKQLHNTLAAGFHRSSEDVKSLLTTIDINPNIRAQDLTVEEWVRLTKEIFSGTVKV